MFPTFLLTAGADTVTMAELISTVSTVVTAVVGWVSTVASTIVSTPLLAFSLGFFAIGGSIAILGRMLSKG